MYPRRRRTVLGWLCALRARNITCLALAAYLVLYMAIPHALRSGGALAPLAGLARAAAPMVALLLLLPLFPALWRARHEWRLVRRLRTLEGLRALDWVDLEILMRRLFERRGYSATRTGGAGADGGVDIVLRRDGRTTLVQCKQWKARRVGVNVVRELLGVVALRRADGGIVVTCGVFTKEAREFARHGNLVLMDGFRVLELAGAETRRAGAGEPAAEEDTCACPRCGGPMVCRVAKAGAGSGRSFLGCAKFPHCRGTRGL